MQHVARVLACLDPDGASAEEWDEILHAQGVRLTSLCDRVYDHAHSVDYLGGPLFPRSVHPQEAMENAVTAGLLPAEFLASERHAFNAGHEPLCACEPMLDADLLCHRIGCRLMTYRTRTAYLLGGGPETEAQAFSILMRAPEMLAADRVFSTARRILWCPRNYVTLSSGGIRMRPDPWLGMGLWARQLGDGVVAIGVPPARFDSRDPGPYTVVERGFRMHAALEAELAARPTFT